MNDDVQDLQDALLGEDEEGLDPDTLANLAALHQVDRDEGDEDDDGQGGADEDHDFSTLLVDSQHTMTREQMQEMVARLAQQGEDEDPDAEGEDDLEADAEGEEAEGGAAEGSGSERGVHKREDTEPLREVGEKGKRGNEEEGDDKKPGVKRRRKRNRTVLWVLPPATAFGAYMLTSIRSCTECHRRVSSVFHVKVAIMLTNRNVCTLTHRY
jgi:hypothetical protein